jgi:hypothetical protein
VSGTLGVSVPLPQPIPERTQPYVDRLVGTTVGDLTVQERLAEGRFSTLYRGQRPSGPATLEVLRLGVASNDEEVRAVDALKCRGVVATSGFGTLPDGRRFRVLEALEGHSLEQRLHGSRPSVDEALAWLGRILKVLDVTHAWAIAHGNLVASSIWVTGEEVRLLDFGLAKTVKPALVDDLVALAGLGVWMLTGTEVTDGPVPRLEPEPVDRFLRAVLERRLVTVAEVTQALVGLQPPPVAPVRHAEPIAASRPGRSVGLVLLAGAAVAFGAWQWRPDAAPAAADDTEALLDEALAPEEPGDGDGATEVVAAQKLGEERPNPAPPRATARRTTKPVPSAQALQSAISGLERTLRAKAGPGTDLDQALFTLNKQRLRLTGAPTAEERRDVARQLAGWRKSYLAR